MDEGGWTKEHRTQNIEYRKGIRAPGNQDAGSRTSGSQNIRRRGDENNEH